MLSKPLLSGLGPRRSAWCRIRISAPRALRILFCWTFGRDFRPIAPLAHFPKAAARYARRSSSVMPVRALLLSCPKVEAACPAAGKHVPRMTFLTMTFAELDLHPTLLQAVEAAGYNEPTPIQEKAIPLALAGRDLVASANTGTGKTAAFVLPALQKLKTPRTPGNFGPRVLILSPTRELATQILDAVRKYSKFDRVQTGVILGGMPYREQLRMLERRVDLIVATPGRLIDHLERGRVDLSGAGNAGAGRSRPHARHGLHRAGRADRRRLPAEPPDPAVLRHLRRPDGSALPPRLLKNPERIDIAGKQTSAWTPSSSACCAPTTWATRIACSTTSCRHDAEGKTIVFTATKRDADRLAEELCDQGPRRRRSAWRHAPAVSATAPSTDLRRGQYPRCWSPPTWRRAASMCRHHPGHQLRPAEDRGRLPPPYRPHRPCRRHRHRLFVLYPERLEAGQGDRELHRQGADEPHHRRP